MMREISIHPRIEKRHIWANFNVINNSFRYLSNVQHDLIANFDINVKHGE